MALEYSGEINHVLQWSDSRQVMDLLSRQEVSLVLLDLIMPNLSGEDLLPLIVEEIVSKLTIHQTRKWPAPKTGWAILILQGL